MKIVNIVGARPNFMKMAPLLREMRRHDRITPLLIHTGQHYDLAMAGRFFEDLQIPPPDRSLEVGSGTHAYQTAEVMKRLEPILEEERPDLVLVVGDVNSTLAAALTAAKLHVPIAHVEAGLRSFDRTMPEEINRVVTDALSDYLFVSEESGIRNLRSEGVDEARIFLVGNVMIDSLETSRELWRRADVHDRLGLTGGNYGVLTLHRPANVDDPALLSAILGAVTEVAWEIPVVFPLHPRTRKALQGTPLDPDARSPGGAGNGRSHGILYADPLGYVDFMALLAGARIVLTDSGGIQEETTVLGVPCLTLRQNTERPVTVTHGTNRIVGSAPQRIVEEAFAVLREPRKAPPRPPLWDGRASERIVSILLARDARASAASVEAASHAR